jgi:hypothetical protein
LSCLPSARRPSARQGPDGQACIPTAVAKGEMSRAAYSLMDEHPFLPHQYFLVFTPRRAGLHGPGE